MKHAARLGALLLMSACGRRELGELDLSKPGNPPNGSGEGGALAAQGGARAAEGGAPSAQGGTPSAQGGAPSAQGGTEEAGLSGSGTTLGPGGKAGLGAGGARELTGGASAGGAAFGGSALGGTPSAGSGRAGVGDGGHQSGGWSALGGSSAGGAPPSNAGAAGNGGAGGATSAGSAAVGGTPNTPPVHHRSCLGLAPICGKPSRDCCGSTSIPTGDFSRGTEPDSGQTMSHVSGFVLDEFEVVGARFNAFLDEYDAWRAHGNPAPGSGAHPLIQGSGWKTEWESTGDSGTSQLLPKTRQELDQLVRSCMQTPFWTGMSNQPVNCVSWYEATAFCIWDGGRLATSLEWEYAAAGGANQWLYPWGNQEPNKGLATYGCNADLPDFPCLVPPVGALSAVKGRWGQLDQAGSLAEWVLDVISTEPFPPCNDCANLAEYLDGNPRTTHGGGWNSTVEELSVFARHGYPAYLHYPNNGIRCAYDLP